MGNIATIEMARGNLNKSLMYYDTVLYLIKFIKDNNAKINIYGNIANLYTLMGNYNKSIDYYFMALKLSEEIKNDYFIAANLLNIGTVYHELGQYKSALVYYNKSLAIYKKINYPYGLSLAYSNISLIEFILGNNEIALDYAVKSLNISNELGDRIQTAIQYANIGDIYSRMKLYDDALKYKFKAIEIFNQIDNKIFLTQEYLSLGKIYFHQNQLDQSELYLKKSELMANQLNNLKIIYRVYDALYDFYEKRRNYQKSNYYLKKSFKIKDSINSMESKKNLEIKEMQYTYEKDRAKREAEHAQQILLQKQKNQRQKYFLITTLIVLILVASFMLLFIHRYNITNKQKKIIQEQNEVLEYQKLILEEQKRLVDQKNKDILDSINYAKRIQNAILPSNAKWKEHLPDSFVLYLPKDIVAGDFYWMEFANKYIYVAAADCTGHGVPGAMVSVVCSNALTKAVLEEKLTETDQILNRTRELVIEKLTSEDNIRDGMDICLVRLEKGKNIIQFSGANRPLYMVNQDKSLTEIKPNKQPIGRYEESKPFTKQEIELNANTWLYLTTDGFADQFGGEKGKKIGTKQFKELLCNNASSNDAEGEKEKLSSFFKEWKGNEEQMDDVTVIGIKT
ncbi:MAG: tetratricopeptide repeat protein [Bacteroidia bacterium]|nr:tetratricopeptide repeat protein [Bacteroidia bacterium]